MGTHVNPRNHSRILLSIFSTIAFVFFVGQGYAQSVVPFRLPDSGQTAGTTITTGEDPDFFINPPSFINNGDGTVTDNNTHLMWQHTDGGEMTIENAQSYCDNLTLAGFTDWRLPTGMELLSINHYQHTNPALDPTYFTTTAAEYWWSSEHQVDDATKIWVVNSGGGIGAHPKTETMSAGGSKRFHVRAVRTLITKNYPTIRYVDQNDGTIYDNYTGLTWQKIQAANTMTWEEALIYANGISLGGKSDWRLPNVKEIQSLNDVMKSKPSFDNAFFPNVIAGNFWSSTSMNQTPSKAWDINVDYGIVSYNEKSVKENVLLVRGGFDNKSLNILESSIPEGEYEMGDHFGFVDPQHPSDEIPIHLVKVDSFFMAKTETSNNQFLAFLNAALLTGSVSVTNNVVYQAGTSTIVCYTNQYESWYSISFDGTLFSLADFRGDHPMVGVMWPGAALFCNWLSLQNGLEECYDPATWDCDFTRNGYRLPTEAEWEFAGRGGHLNPYYNYPNGNTVDGNQTNIPNSLDPYETGPYPQTTPVGFYDGTLKLKTDYNWPSNVSSYQTNDGSNGFGLYDMQGNVWELINDWYGQNYYSVSPYDNPEGPESGFIMPDGKPYRGMRGGNWYNGYVNNGVNDGHSRVSNRNPSYYRGPQDPNHPWYHVGFRIARKFSLALGIDEPSSTGENQTYLLRCYPNPATAQTTLSIYAPENACANILVRNSYGKALLSLQTIRLNMGWNMVVLPCSDLSAGLYIVTLTDGKTIANVKLIIKP